MKEYVVQFIFNSKRKNKILNQVNRAVSAVYKEVPTLI